MNSTCTEVTQQPLRWGGEFCRCILPAIHVFDVATHWHRCSCGTTWVDDQQIDEARRCEAAGRPFLAATDG